MKWRIAFDGPHGTTCYAIQNYARNGVMTDDPDSAATWDTHAEAWRELESRRRHSNPTNTPPYMRDVLATARVEPIT